MLTGPGKLICGYIVGIVQKITMNKRAKSNTIRLISGQWRGRRLPVLDSDGLRPTTDRVRETLFNWLMHDVSGANCLDLFAGSGALGLECLSRGAARVEFVESNKAVCETLRSNLFSLEVGRKASLHCDDGLAFLNHQPVEPFDLVFLDPPFSSNLIEPAMTLLVANDWLAESALVYVEQSSTRDDPRVPETWSIHREGKAGQSRYWLYAV